MTDIYPDSDGDVKRAPYFQADPRHWRALREVLPRPWPSEAVDLDLAYLEGEARAGRPVPSGRELARTWGLPLRTAQRRMVRHSRVSSASLARHLESVEAPLSDESASEARHSRVSSASPLPQSGQQPLLFGPSEEPKNRRTEEEDSVVEQTAAPGEPLASVPSAEEPTPEGVPTDSLDALGDTSPGEVAQSAETAESRRDALLARVYAVWRGWHPRAAPTLDQRRARALLRAVRATARQHRDLAGRRQVTPADVAAAEADLVALVRWAHEAPDASWYREQNRTDLATLCNGKPSEAERIDRARAWAAEAASESAAPQVEAPPAPRTDPLADARQAWDLAVAATSRHRDPLAHLPARAADALRAVGPSRLSRATSYDLVGLRTAFVEHYVRACAGAAGGAR